MPRRNVALRKAGRAATPGNILVFDTETWHGKKVYCEGGESHRLRLGCALAYRLEDGQRTRVQRMFFTEVDSFWRFVESRQSQDRPLWVFAHNLPYDMGIVDGWRRVMDGGFRCYKFALTSQLNFIFGEDEHGSINYCDTINYWKSPLEEVGAAVGLPKMPMPDQPESDAVWQRYCENDVEVTAAAVDHLIEFLRANQLGPWGPSIASLAMKCYRSKFMTPYSIYIHSNHEAMALERGAYYGGITECNRIGRIDGPVYELDVCSMYPSVCMNSLPTNLAEPPISCSVSTAMDYIHGYMGVADVEIQTSTVRYPCRSKNGTVYPVGRYRTHLADAELRQAIRDGHVSRVHRIGRYDCASHLQSYMKYFGDLKCSYCSPEQRAFRTLAKYFLNSLYGKFGQQTDVWEKWGEESLRDVEELYGLKPFALAYCYEWPPVCRELEDVHCIPHLGMQLDIRDLFGFTEVKVGRRDGKESLVAVAACVTSYARVLLREFQRIAGPREWYYSDTDSLWCSECGRDRLRAAGVVGEGVIGQLEEKPPVDWLHVYGPKDYETPLGVKIKGVKMSKSPQSPSGTVAQEVIVGGKRMYVYRAPDGSYHQTQFPSAMRQIGDAKWGEVYVRHVLKELARQQTKWKVGPGGWCRSLRYPEEETA